MNNFIKKSNSKLKSKRYNPIIFVCQLPLTTKTKCSIVSLYTESLLWLDYN